ncbi:MAG: non-canonical purine NTP pyrophosphatase, partial [Chloroflexota bacterium]
MQKLLLATKNQGKIEELKDLLHHVDAEILTPDDLGLELEVEESGKTYRGNAGRKALA